MREFRFASPGSPFVLLVILATVAVIIVDLVLLPVGPLWMAHLLVGPLLVLDEVWLYRGETRFWARVRILATKLRH